MYEFGPLASSLTGQPYILAGLRSTAGLAVGCSNPFGGYAGSPARLFLGTAFRRFISQPAFRMVMISRLI